MLRIASISPKIELANCHYNAAEIIRLSKKALEKGASIALFPELSISGYSCGDLFFLPTLKKVALEAVEYIRKESINLPKMAIIVGLPIEVKGKLYNCMATISEGDITAITPLSSDKINFETYNKQTAPGEILINELCVPFGKESIIFDDTDFIIENNLEEISYGKNILNPTAITLEAAFLSKYTQIYKRVSKSRLIITASAGENESVDDGVYSGLKALAVNGKLICAETGVGIKYFDIDKDIEKSKPYNSNNSEEEKEGQKEPIEYSLKEPFIPSKDEDRDAFCMDILNIQTMALARRYKDIYAKGIVLGLSGGLDSTVALLAAVNACDYLGISRKNIYAISMPGFGTSDITKSNAYKLAKVLGVSFENIDINDICKLHLDSIGQKRDRLGNFITDVTFENAQARMRTMILMNKANSLSGFVLGTGDMSELALGWCTYNGDQMSMYAINSGLPKTLIRHILRTYAKNIAPYKMSEEDLASFISIIEGIINTPISPELLPLNEDESFSQITQDFIGPYILHDFFLCHMARYKESPDIILDKATSAFAGIYDKEEIIKWEKFFYKRFFTQQFKRSCMPTGPKVLDFSLSPRDGFQIPSDAVSKIWLDHIK